MVNSVLRDELGWHGKARRWVGWLHMTATMAREQSSQQQMQCSSDQLWPRLFLMKVEDSSKSSGKLLHPPLS